MINFDKLEKQLDSEINYIKKILATYEGIKILYKNDEILVQKFKKILPTLENVRKELGELKND